MVVHLVFAPAEGRWLRTACGKDCRSDAEHFCSLDLTASAGLATCKSCLRTVAGRPTGAWALEGYSFEKASGEDPPRTKGRA